jgi:hypothetical protein
MSAASDASAGLPSRVPPSATVVSAVRMGAGGRPRRVSRSTAGVEFGEHHALDVHRRRFVRAHGFQRLGVFVVIGQQQPEIDADLLQQLLAARTLGREVDEGGHGGDVPARGPVCKWRGLQWSASANRAWSPCRRSARTDQSR